MIDDTWPSLRPGRLSDLPCAFPPNHGPKQASFDDIDSRLGFDSNRPASQRRVRGGRGHMHGDSSCECRPGARVNDPFSLSPFRFVDHQVRIKQPSLNQCGAKYNCCRATGTQNRRHLRYVVSVHCCFYDDGHIVETALGKARRGCPVSQFNPKPLSSTYCCLVLFPGTQGHESWQLPLLGAKRPTTTPSRRNPRSSEARSRSLPR